MREITVDGTFEGSVREYNRMRAQKCLAPAVGHIGVPQPEQIPPPVTGMDQAATPGHVQDVTGEL